MQEGGPAHLPDLAVAEEARQRGAGYAIQEDVAVVVGPPEQVLSPAQAREQQRPRGPGRIIVLHVAVHHGFQVLSGRICVPYVELDHLALAQHLADNQGARLLVEAHHVADQEIAGAKLVLQRVHDHPQVQGRVYKPSVMAVRFVEHFSQRLQRTPTVQLHQ